MRKTIPLILALSASLLAYNDYDMDGVDDKIDKCPNTSFSELVDISGCTIKSLKSSHHFDIIVGIDYSQKNYDTLEDTETFSQSLQIDYYYKNFSLQASSSYYNSQSTTYNNGGMNDSFLGAYYKLKPSKELTVRLGTGVIISTYDTDLNNNNTDFTTSVSLSYTLKKVNIFGGMSYTIINDDDIDTVDTLVLYQNTSSQNIGVGFYPTAKSYMSIGYNISDSIYKDVDKIKTLSFNAFYNIDANWFATANYAFGLSDTASDNYASLRLGYYF
jgi:hypothetical protein